MASSASTSHSTDETLSLGLLNINSLKNKIPDVRYIMAEHQLQVVALCETKLDSTVEDSKLYIPGYRMYRRDREGNGGGVTLYIQSHIPTKLRSDLMNPEVEIVWVEMKLSGRRPVLVGCCYRPPSSNAKYLEQICEMIEKVSKEARDIFLLGDINIDCQNGILENRTLRSTISACRWTQIVNVNTRVTDGSSKCIDHIYTNIPGSCSELKSIITGCSDHNLITVRVSKKIPEVTRYHRSLETFDHESFIRDLMEAPWSDVETETDPQKALDKFNKIFIFTAVKHAPIKTTNIYEPLMVDEEFKSLFKKRDEAKREKNTEEHDKYKDEISKKKQQTESFRELEDAGNDRDRVFKGYDLPFHVIDVKYDESSTSRAEFLKYLKHIQTESENLQSVFDGFEAQYEMKKETFSFKKVKPENIRTLLLSLCKSGIIDQTEVKLFRPAADFISAPICHILNGYISRAVFPSEWNKVRNILCQTGKYTFIREINCLSSVDFVLSLMLDMILLQQTKQYFTDKNLILLASLHDELKEVWLSDIKYTTVLCFSSDFSSSFDTISRKVLIKKLKSYGFSASALKLMKSFLSDRSAGLPRGSFFSHFLFMIYTNDLRRVLKSSSVVMSDNQFLIYCSGKDRQKLEQLLKADLESVFVWADENGLILNRTEPIFPLKLMTVIRGILSFGASLSEEH